MNELHALTAGKKKCIIANNKILITNQQLSDADMGCAEEILQSLYGEIHHSDATDAAADTWEQWIAKMAIAGLIDARVDGSESHEKTEEAEATVRLESAILYLQVSDKGHVQISIKHHVKEAS